MVPSMDSSFSGVGPVEPAVLEDGLTGIVRHAEPVLARRFRAQRRQDPPRIGGGALSRSFANMGAGTNSTPSGFQADQMNKLARGEADTTEAT